MLRSIILTLSILAVFCHGANADEVRFTASAKNVVSVGERFNLIFKLTAEGKNFRGPSTNDFNILNGPYSSSSSSVQIINGRVSKMVEITYTYVLAAIKEGEFEIPAASVVVEGKTYKSNPVKIKVVKRQSSSGTRPSTGSNQQSKGGSNLKDQVFLKALANKTNPLQGEQIIVTFKIYTKVPISHIDINKMASFPGFWSKNMVDEKKQLRQYTEYINGEEFVVADVRKVALFPQKSGKLKIEPLEMQCVAQVRQKSQQKNRDPFFDSFFNDPFFNRYQNVGMNIKSNTLNINVKPLPVQNKPVSFTGAVGSFDFKSEINKNELSTNEAVNLKFTISGRGNIELIDLPAIQFPPDFEVYDPKISQNININDNGVSGWKSFEYLIIPRRSGEFKISPISFSYFDLQSRQYRSIPSKEFLLDIIKGKETGTPVTYSGINQEDIQYIGSDIRYISTDIPKFARINSYFFGSIWFFILLISPFVIFILIVIIWKKELKKRNNTALMRNRKATKIAHQRLKNAHQSLDADNNEIFYIELSKALWGYVSDKFSIPVASLSADTAEETLANENINKETIDRFLNTIKEIEFSRFAPGESSGARKNLYEMAVNAITKMERELK